MKLGESQRTFNDVVTYQADANFAVKTVNIPNLAVEVQPGSVIKADGTAFTSGNDALLVLSHHRAGTDANIIVADRGVYIRPETVIAVMGATVGAAAIAALTTSDVPQHRGTTNLIQSMHCTPSPGIHGHRLPGLCHTPSPSGLYLQYFH